MKLKQFFIKLINFYQKILSPLKRPSCVFYPTCSEYTKQAIEKYGAFKGLYLGLRESFVVTLGRKNTFIR